MAVVDKPIRYELVGGPCDGMVCELTDLPPTIYIPCVQAETEEIERLANERFPLT